MRRTLHGLAMPEDGGDASEQLCAVDGRIFVAEGVTAGREDGAVAIWPFADHAMHEEAPAEQEKNDLAATRVDNRFGADREHITWVNRGNHAAAVDDKANFAEAVQHFGGKIEASFLLRFRNGGVNERACQEFLRLKRH